MSTGRMRGRGALTEKQREMERESESGCGGGGEKEVGQEGRRNRRQARVEGGREGGERDERQGAFVCRSMNSVCIDGCVRNPLWDTVQVPTGSGARPQGTRWWVSHHSIRRSGLEFQLQNQVNIDIYAAYGHRWNSPVKLCISLQSPCSPAGREHALNT